jgi:hypothetical protein
MTTLMMDTGTLHRCKACGSLVEAGSNFCSECGTRQIDEEHRPEPVVTPVPDADHPSAPILLMLVILGAAGLLLALATGVVVGGVGANLDGFGGGGDGDAADAMDDFGPVAEEWRDKHEHVADEGSGDDANGLALAANDAAAWIEVNEADLRAAADSADGTSAPLYDDLMGIFERRAEVLASIETTAAAGGTGLGAAAGELSELDVLDQQATATACDIAEVMRSEGDEPADHLPTSLRAACA